jgi:nitrogen fixation/metabolism regulation signal transduction histidine kinase
MKIGRRFRTQVAWRLGLLGLAAGFFFYLQFSAGFRTLALFCAAVFIFSLVSLFRYIDRSNRGLTRFLQAVRYHDFSLSPGIEGLGGSFADLNAAFREISAQFQKARTEKEEQYRYLLTVVQHIGVGLMSLKEDGSVDLLNNVAKRLLCVSHLRHIRDLPPSFQPLAEEIRRLRPGEKTLCKLELPDEVLQLALYSTEFKMQNGLYKLVSLQNIQVELEEKESEAWQSLTRVLTHEIMNSLTPIASLAATASAMLQTSRGDKQGVGLEWSQDVVDAVQTIHRRSQGLMRFVQTYRSIALIPRPQFEIFPVTQLFQRVEKLMKGKMAAQRIAFTASVEPKSLELTADPDLVEQVLINLLLNAMEALGGCREPGIQLSSWMNERGRVIIQVTDNGLGIAPEVKDNVFIPFFTTKKEGSGIGLSFARQVMHLHRGLIAVRSQPGAGSVFTLRF